MTFNKIMAAAAAVYVPAVAFETAFRKVKIQSLFLNNSTNVGFISQITVKATKSFAGYKLGEYFAGDDASLTKTVIASAVCGAAVSTACILNILENKTNFYFYGDMIISPAVSSGLLAYINYEDKSSAYDKTSELDIHNIDHQDI